jgi:hypothetical protein
MTCCARLRGQALGNAEQLRISSTTSVFFWLARSFWVMFAMPRQQRFSE